MQSVITLHSLLTKFKQAEMLSKTAKQKFMSTSPILPGPSMSGSNFQVPKQKSLPPLLPPPLPRQREIPLLQTPLHPSHSLLLLKFSIDSIIAARVQAANLFPIFDQRNQAEIDHHIWFITITITLTITITSLSKFLG